MTCNNTELLRVTVLSLEGIHLLPSGNNNDDVAKKNATRIITAWAGFRSSFPPESMSIPSPHYSTLFAGEGNDLLAMGSEGVAWKDNSNFGMVHWRGDEEGGRSQRITEELGDTNDTTTDSIQDSSQCHKSVPHLEIKLPSSPSTSQPGNGGHAPRPPDAIEFHVSIVCTSSVDDHPSCIGDEFYESDDDASLGMEGHCGHEKQHVCHGIAHLKLSPSELGMSADSICGYNRPGGKVVILPVRTSESSPDGNAYYRGQSKDIVTLAKDAIISVRVERVCVPAQHFRKKEQRHYVESDWRGGSFAPPSIIHHDSVASKGKDAAGLSELYLRATSKFTMMAKPTITTDPTMTKPPKIEKQDEMVGKIVEALEYRCPSTKDTPFTTNTSSEPRQMNEMATSEFVVTRSITYQNNHGNKKGNKPTKRPNQTEKTRTKSPSKKCLSQKISEKFLCGASFGDVLKMAGEAGHHCDEDHVGLYVADSDSLGSSIATADVMGL